MPAMSTCEALCMSFRYMLKKDKSVFIIGVGLSHPSGLFGTIKGLYEEFPGRVIDAPLSEAMLTGLLLGAALEGMKPILMHARINFTFLGMDQIVNHIAVWNKMFGGSQPLPLLIRGVVGEEGWGNGAQHLGDYKDLFCKIKGMRVYDVETPFDAVFSLSSWFQGSYPAILIDHKDCYDMLSDVGGPKDD